MNPTKAFASGGLKPQATPVKTPVQPSLAQRYAGKAGNFVKNVAKTAGDIGGAVVKGVKDYAHEYVTSEKALKAIDDYQAGKSGGQGEIDAKRRASAQADMKARYSLPKGGKK